mmetsp:Transcript_14737/g.13218  ORF Transcript_14737/g.13218 Transcript_14737/m.13218 type:complete len:196 (-) Transcript_14737:186-773(-)
MNIIYDSIWLILTLTTLTESCGTLVDDLPTIGLKTANVRFGNSNGDIIASVRTTNGWSTWRNLDNSACNDFEKKNTDYFNNFNDIVEPWMAVALYACHTDGWAMDELGYWNGKEIAWIKTFCQDIGGPGARRCGIKKKPNQYCTFDETLPVFDAYWLEQDETFCPLVVIDTSISCTSGHLGRSYYTISDPGRPQC